MKVIEIKEEVNIQQEGQIIVLEAGDKIEIIEKVDLEESVDRFPFVQTLNAIEPVMVENARNIASIDINTYGVNIVTNVRDKSLTSRISQELAGIVNVGYVDESHISVKPL